jgi:hypothetical protein
MKSSLLNEPDEFELSLTQPGSDANAFFPTFNIPVLYFLQCRSVWTALQLSTIFWERPVWGIVHESGETDKIKKAYLLANANYDAWANKTLIDNEWITSGAYFELVVYKPDLVEKIKVAFQNHGIIIIHHENNFVSLVKNV